MTCLEHLIENCLADFETNKSAEEIIEAIKKDINYEYAGITAEQCYEICQYVRYVYLPTADVVEVVRAQENDIVRCKECKYLMFSDCYGECSKAYKGIVNPDDYCGWGEKEEGDAE